MDFFHNTVHSWRKKQNQQVESYLGHLICNGPPNPSFNRPPLLPWLCYIYIYRCTVQVSAWVCRADFQVSFLMCSHSNMTPGADQSCGLRGSGWGTALAMPLAFPKGLLYLNRCLCFFCMLQCRKTIAGCGELSQHQTRQKWTCQPQLSHFPGILLSRTDEAKLNWP